MKDEPTRQQSLHTWTVDCVSRGRDEVYGAVCSPDAGSGSLAYHRITGKRESLVYRADQFAEETCVAENTYILSPCFAANRLFWSAPRQGAWNIESVMIEGDRTEGEPHQVQCAGRPTSLSSFSSPDGAILVWEERAGKSTGIRLSLLSDTGPGTPITITSGEYNGYDPCCCIGPDGTIYVAYCAFRGGQYCIELQRLSPDGVVAESPVRLSNQAAACVHPSACCGPDGRIWFSYTSYQGGGQEQGYVQSLSHRGRKRFFETDTLLLAGFYKGGSLHAVHAPPNPKNIQGLTAAMVVYGSDSADYSRVFCDTQGRVRLLMRRHAPGAPIPSEEHGMPQHKHLGGGRGESRLAHPGIALATLENDSWSQPICLIENAHAAMGISLNLHDSTLRFAYTKDTRQTGWGQGAEWFDITGQLGVGLGKLELPEAGVPEYRTFPFRVHERPGSTIEEEPVKHEMDGYRHAMGQTHMHTNLSVCIRDRDRDPNMNYRFTQDAQHSDFGGTTDHAYNMWDTEMLVTRKLAEYYYFPGEFVALPAYEWTGTPAAYCSHEDGPWGHVNPLYFEEQGDLEFYTPADPTCRGGSLQRLAETYRGKKILAPPHHVADYMHAYNWDHFYEEMQPIVEIFQDMRGSGEQPKAAGVSNWLHQEDGHWLLEQLKAGRKFGFIASADHGGIARAGVLVRELTRTGLFEALVARRCFASTGRSMAISFVCNGQNMGSEVQADRAEFSIEIASAVPVEELQIVRDGETVDTIAQDARHTTYRWEAEPERNGEFWYVRALFADGEMAWSSPIWLVGQTQGL
jgi:hypothetical protein